MTIVLFLQPLHVYTIPTVRHPLSSSTSARFLSDVQLQSKCSRFLSTSLLTDPSPFVLSRIKIWVWRLYRKY
ncbi:hypothetical protein L6452_19274 [Arctium lappa]|uniref:Uncharacterized protein n=1 Tax=Arctium lappa TaxID=4217 RepID=A0ACB9BCK3_ARCLA|nr:hypothetical protein L6452_19274 [Arctium lappa]